MNEHRTISKVSRYLEYNDRAKMHPPSSLTFLLWSAMRLSLFLRGNRRQFLVEKILSEEEECFDPTGRSFVFVWLTSPRAFRRKGPEASE